MSFDLFSLQGYQLRPAQTWGSVWLVPIVRDEISPGDLRLRSVKQEMYVAKSTYEGANFFSYMPSAYVMDWSDDGSVVATAEPHLHNKGQVTSGKLWRRTQKNQMGFLPQSLAIEGFLVQHFDGPRIGWLDYHRDVRRGNLGFRAEATLPGWFLKAMTEAIRIFEFAEDQVGSALFVDGKLINCFLCPHPSDYARLHESLLSDLYPAYLVHYGYLREGKANFTMNCEKVEDLTSLRQEFERAMDRTLQQEILRLDSLLGRSLENKKLYQAGPFTLQRFIAEIEPEGDNYCGEVILRDDKQVEYLKLYHLSRAEMRRLSILRALSAHDWDLARAAKVLEAKGSEGVARMMVGADLGYLLNPGVWGHLLKGTFV